ncbi:MAG: DUF58 domain-containing protein [Gammaproteobacteria bacterium]
MTDAAARLLTPEVLAGLANLELVARTAVEGFLVGLHRSPHFGFSQEFAEFRAYNEGDDPRFVDWNVFARTERTYIRRYEGETNTRLMLLLGRERFDGLPVGEDQQASVRQVSRCGACVSGVEAARPRLGSSCSTRRFVTTGRLRVARGACMAYSTRSTPRRRDRRPISKAASVNSAST